MIEFVIFMIGIIGVGLLLASFYYGCPFCPLPDTKLFVVGTVIVLVSVILVTALEVGMI